MSEQQDKLTTDKRPCKLADVLVRPDYYYHTDAYGNPNSALVTVGEEHVFFCQNCGDVSYTPDSMTGHLGANK